VTRGNDSTGAHVEFGLGGSPGWMEERGRGGLADVGEDPGDGFGAGEQGDEREGCLAGWTCQGEGFLDPGQGAAHLVGREEVVSDGWGAGLGLGGEAGEVRGTPDCGIIVAELLCTEVHS